MIVKNEEDVLARCLGSVRDFADEIIVVDTGSDDRTKEIARSFTDRVFDFAWIDDFSAARNYAFSLATKEYILWLDADDVIESKDLEAFRELKRTLQRETDYVYCKYNVAFDREGNPTFSYYRERIVRNCPSAIWCDPIHEVISPFGKTMFCDAAVTHKKLHAAQTGRNLRVYESYLAKGKKLSARMKFYYARELMYNGFQDRAVAVYENFLDDPKGFFENKIAACRDLYRCRKACFEAKPDASPLFRSFEYAAPRAEILCEIGLHFFERSEYAIAEYWYQSALEKTPDETSLGFVERDCYGYIPYLQLCVICDRTGRRAQAQEFNELAGALKPESEAYRLNRQYFLSVNHN